MPVVAKLKDYADGINTITVMVKKAFEPKSNPDHPEYGESMFAYLTDGSREYSHYFKEKDFDLIKEGHKILLVKKEYMGSPYFEVYSVEEDKKSVAEVVVEDKYSSNFDPEDLVDETFGAKPKPKKEEPNLFGRGASWNNAFAYCLEFADASDNIDDFCEFVALTAENIEPHQKKFVNKYNTN